MVRIQILCDEIRKGQSIALGNFDGLHLGHQAVLELAATMGDLAVVSFKPHPKRFFNPQFARFELMNSPTFNRVARSLGAKSLYQIGFDQDLSMMSAQTFLDALNDRIKPSAIATGADFRFGQEREGDVEFLQAWCKGHNIVCKIAPEIIVDEEKVSSTRIRSHLENGEPRVAAQYLGRPHIINDIVTQGDQRGRDLGYPTANLYPKNVMLPKYGIYASRLRIHDGLFKGDYQGASSLGVRPSFGVNQPNFETHILDFDGDIYGNDISVELIEYLRGEIKFESIDELIQQMDDDVEKCRIILDA